MVSHNTVKHEREVKIWVRGEGVEPPITIEFTWKTGEDERDEERVFSVDFEVYEENPLTGDLSNNFHGFIKWDECMQWLVRNEGAYQFHFDGFEDAPKFFTAVNEAIFENASDIMGGLG